MKEKTEVLPLRRKARFAGGAFFDPFFSVVLLASAISGAKSQIYDGCVLEDYYQSFQGSDVKTWTKSQVHQLLQQTHRNILPYTSSTRDDVWDALMDLDASSETAGYIRLIYRDVDVPSEPFGTPDTWNREHLWPRSRGVGESGPDNTDIHALRPADWNVNSSRGNLFFGDCGVSCSSRPATAETALDTARSSDVFLPPATVRGDIARALMYMATRYSSASGTGVEPLTTVLELTDCPDESASSQMAYLSELLQWHIDDPPDDREKARNDLACSRWQGNRNIFVDYPELAEIFFGVPLSKPYYCPVQNSPSDQPSTAPSSSPSLSNAPTIFDPCSEISAGAVQVVGFNSDNPDSVALVALENLPPNLELIMTENAWTGDSFLTNEGTLLLHVPPEGISQGTVFGFGQDSTIAFSNSWESLGGNFALSTSGDSVILYCESSTLGINPLGAFTTGTWQEGFASSYNTNESALPKALAMFGSIETVTNLDNYVYMGITRGTRSELLVALGNENNWYGSNSERFTFNGQFSVIPDNGNNPASQGGQSGNGGQNEGAGSDPSRGPEDDPQGDSGESEGDLSNMDKMTEAASSSPKKLGHPMIFALAALVGIILPN